MGANWETLIMAFLHDPPDKALAVREHATVTKKKYLPAALGRPITDQEFESATKRADRAAATAERFPFPKRPFVDPDPGGVFTTFHPVSAAERRIACGDSNAEMITTIITDIVSGLESAETRFLALWRLLPERIAQEMGADWRQLPAETRQPDHTLWHHVDIATAFAAADETADEKYTFLSFTIGPVQEFITAAWSLRDLFTGSTLLSWLTFQAMRPILEQWGPSALIFPHLRGNFLADQWLKSKIPSKKIPEGQPDPTARPALALPNRFLALVPAATAHAVGEDCEQSVRAAWKKNAGAVQDTLKREFDCLSSDWDTRWDEQIATVPEVSWVAVPASELMDEAMATMAGGTFGEIWPDAEAIRNLAKAIPESGRPYLKNHAAGRWQARVETVAKIAEAARQIRPAPGLPSQSQRLNPDKCTILGSFDQMGPPARKEADVFWTAVREKSIKGVHLRKHERLCAISLTKRFALSCCLGEALGLDHESQYFPDTAIIAAQCWLKQAQIDPKEFRATYKFWNGQWLHGRKGPDSGDWPENQKENVKEAFDNLQSEVRNATQSIGRPPPGYYAILVADGDQMGEWLAGRKAPQVREVLHRTLVDHFVDSFKDRPDQDVFAKGLNAQRPVGPALHAAISTGLQHFASVLVPEIVKSHFGTLVYSGGDDVLALMPVETALACANDLRAAFSTDAVMGGKASLSAGLAVVHTMEDLRQALQAAREAEKVAKSGGRDQLGGVVVRRSGEKGEFRVPWTMVQNLDALRGFFTTGAMSDRWIYHLRSAAITLKALPRDAQRAELGRLLKRADAVDESGMATVLALFDDFAAWDQGRAPADALLSTFAVVCQATSFFARVRDK